MFWKKKKPKEFVTIVPVTKSIRYNSKLQPFVVKRQIAQKMLEELLLYIDFSLEDKGDGTTLLVGRLDVLKKEKENENGKEGNEQGGEYNKDNE